jgi:hypothetical protein
MEGWISFILFLPILIQRISLLFTIVFDLGQVKLIFFETLIGEYSGLPSAGDYKAPAKGERIWKRYGELRRFGI